MSLIPDGPFMQMTAFQEDEDFAYFTCLVHGLVVRRQFENKYEQSIVNGTLISDEIKSQSFNVAIKLDTKLKDLVYRLKINVLPTEILPEESKILYDKERFIVKLKKKHAVSWKIYAEYAYDLKNMAR